MMIEVQKLTKESKAVYDKYLNNNPERMCGLTFGILYFWDPRERTHYFIHEDTFYLFNQRGSRADFFFPMGSAKPERAFRVIEEFCKENGYALFYLAVSENQKLILENYYGERVRLKEERDWADYLYRYSDLMQLSGKKYHGQRNHLNRFLRLYPSYGFVKYDKSFLPAVKKFITRYYQSVYKESDLFLDEKKALLRFLAECDGECMLGGLLLVEDEVVALSFGEIVGDTLYVHFEKALREYPGSYAMINQSFCSFYYQEDVRFINREEDVGDVGLRTAKLSLHPVKIIPKFFGKVSF